jgi:hypothetical protein
VRAITEHLDRRRDELYRYASGALTHGEVERMLGLAADGAGGIVDGAIPFDDSAIMHINEFVEIGPDGRVKIRRYSYYLVVDDNEVCGYDLNPLEDPASHYHVGPHSNVEACEQVTMRAAYEEFWDRYNEVRAQPARADVSEPGTDSGELG